MAAKTKRQFSHPSLTRLHIIAEITMILIIVIASSVLFGFLTDIDFLKRWGKNNVAMNPMSAVFAIILGIALFLVRNEQYTKREGNISKALSLMISIIAIIKLLSIIMGFNFRIDRLLFESKLYEPVTHSFSEVPPNSVLNFLLLGLAIFLIDKENVNKRRPTEYLCILVFLTSLLTIYGYVYGVRYLYGVSTFAPMPFNSAISFLLFSLCILFSRPNKGSMAIVIGESAGELFYLRIIALFLPLLFGWIKLKGESIGIINKEAGTALFAIFTYIVSMILIGRRSALQHKLREERQRTERIIREDSKRLKSILDNSNAVIYIRDLSGNFIIVNRNYLQLYNLSIENIVGKSLNEIFPKEVAHLRRLEDLEAIETGKPHTIEETIWQGNVKRIFLTIRFPLKDTEGKIYSVCGISTDITQLKQYESELIENEKRLRTILESIGDGVIVTDSNGKFIIFNKAAEEIMGTGPLDSSPEEWAEQYHIYYPDCQNKFPIEDLPLRRAIMGHATDEVEFCIKNPGFTEVKSISSTSRPIKKEDGSFAGVTIVRDITERKKLDVAVLEQQQKLLLERKRVESIIENVDEAVIVVDSDGRPLTYNHRAMEILGPYILSNPKDWAEKFNVYYPDCATVAPQDDLALNRALRGLPTDTLEWCIKNPHNHGPVRILVKGRPIKKGDGTYLAVAIMKDITKKKILETTVHDYDLYLKGILSSTEEGILIVDKNGNFPFVNKQAEELFGKGPIDTELSGWPAIYNFYYPDGKNVFPWNQHPLVKALNGETEFNLELLVMSAKIKSKRIIMSGQSILDESGKITGAIITFRDITDYKEIESKLQVTEKKYKKMVLSMYSNQGLT